MHQVHNRGEHVGIGFRLDAMPEVEDVSRVTTAVWTIAIVGEHGAGSGQRSLGASEYECGIEVALHDKSSAHSTPRLCDRCAPIETKHRRPCGVHLFQQVVAADTEVNSGCVREGSAQCAEHCRRVRQHERLIVGGAQGTGPRVEQLERARTVAQLTADRLDGMFY